MSTNFTGENKPTTKKGMNTAVAIAVVTGVGLAVPFVTTATASAATVSDWDKIAQCESTGRWNLPYGHADSTGGLQFQRASWNDALSYLRSKGISTAGYPSMPYQATKQQQIIAGEALLALQGPGAWTCNAKVGYPLKSSGPHGSMFKGGINPYAGSTTPSTPKPSTPKPSTPATPTKPSTPSAPVGEKYTVKSGDTLSAIAKSLNVAGGWQKLYEANKDVVGSNPNLIKPGQVLTVPSSESKYTVKSGDTLFKIAQEHKVSGGWSKVYEDNKDVIGPNANAIKPGMVLTINGGSTAPSTTTPKPSTPSVPATPSKPTTPAPTTQGYVKPIAGGYYKGDNINVASGCISRSCGGHSGLDLSIRAGTPVRAIANATVTNVGGAGAAYGNHVVIKLPDGKYALYAHLASVNVRVGQTVTAGQTIGTVGSTGNSSGPHLHFEIRFNPTQFYVGNFLNPVTYLASKGVTV